MLVGQDSPAPLHRRPTHLSVKCLGISPRVRRLGTSKAARRCLKFSVTYVTLISLHGTQQMVVPARLYIHLDHQAMAPHVSSAKTNTNL